jgi:transposase
MIKQAMYTTIITLHRQGISQRRIARTTGTDRKTVKKIIRRYTEDGAESPVSHGRPSILTPWHNEIVGLLEKNLSFIRILEELHGKGCQISYPSLTRYIKKHHIKNSTCIRFHTGPGEEAQVDFGEIGRQYDQQGCRRKAYVFNMRLSFSRLDYYEVVFDQSCQTWINCHINAFNYFAGVPKVIKLDNLKAAVIDASFYEPVYQKEYKRLADHYNFWLSPCRVYQPQEKGKVESGIKYIKNNFFAGRTFDNYSDLAFALNNWLDKANSRLHGTTRKIPAELFNEEEKACLTPLPVAGFDLSSWHNRKVAKDCHITVDNNYYSVPAKYAASEVMVQLSPQVVQIFSASNELIARHARSCGRGIFTTNLSHYATDKRQCPGFTEYDERLEKQMQDMGDNCKLMLVTLQKERSYDWQRRAKGIVALRKTYNDEIIDKACQRALHYGIVSYSRIKAILESNAVNLPLPDNGGGHAESA